jgi:outer membrane receptor for monomeric catechols
MAGVRRLQLHGQRTVAPDGRRRVGKANNGNQMPNTPKNSASLWTTYSSRRS